MKYIKAAIAGAVFGLISIGSAIAVMHAQGKPIEKLSHFADGEWKTTTSTLSTANLQIMSEPKLSLWLDGREIEIRRGADKVVMLQDDLFRSARDYFDQQKSGRGPLTAFSGAGSEGNAWNAAAVGIAGVSTVFDSGNRSFCSAVGNSSAASTITVQHSVNGTTFYSTTVNTGAITGNFGVNWTTGTRYIRLISSAASTITATVACKD